MICLEIFLLENFGIIYKKRKIDSKPYWLKFLTFKFSSPLNEEAMSAEILNRNFLATPKLSLDYSKILEKKKGRKNERNILYLKYLSQCKVVSPTSILTNCPFIYFKVWSNRSYLACFQAIMYIFRQITEIIKLVAKSRVVFQLEIAWWGMTKYSHQEKYILNWKTHYSHSSLIERTLPFLTSNLAALPSSEL